MTIIRSMTAFAQMSGQDEWGNIAWEMRSVNHRYLEFSINLPEPLRALEETLRERVKNKINRGKLECVLRYRQGTSLDIP